MPTRVYVVDDDHEVVTRLTAVLEDSPDCEVVGTSPSGAEALRALRHVDVDVVLLDLNMPRLNGIETLERIRQRWPELRVVVLTSHVDRTWLLPAIRLGVNGYVVKTMPPEQLVAAVTQDAASFPTSPEVVRALAGDSQPAERHRIHVTSREQDTLDRLAIGMTNIEIADDLGVSVSLVKKLIQSLSTKLEAANRTQIVSRAAQLGLATARHVQTPQR